MTRPVAVVTGASRGIGRAAALELAAAGFDLVVAARTLHDGDGRLDADPAVAVPGGLDTLVEAVDALGGRAVPVLMDLLDRATVDRVVPTALAEFGRLDVLVNNAIYQGPGTNERFERLTDEHLDRILTGNVTAQLALIRHALPHLLERGGTVVNMISATAHTDPPGPVGEGGWGMAYAMSKAAFARVAPILHVEHREQGLRIFSVDPGFVITEAMRARGSVAQYEANFVAAGPAVIGTAIRWLCTDPASDDLRGAVVFAQREVRRRGLEPLAPPA